MPDAVRVVHTNWVPIVNEVVHIPYVPTSLQHKNVNNGLVQEVARRKSSYISVNVDTFIHVLRLLYQRSIEELVWAIYWRMKLRSHFLLLLIAFHIQQQDCFRSSLCSSCHPRTSVRQSTYRLSNNANDDQSKVGSGSSLSLPKLLSAFPSLPENTISTSAKMFLLSAPLGMMLDNYHGM